MPVQNIECHIAQAQVSRLLGGDSFSPEVLFELETHVATCEECRTFVASRRTALESMVNQVPPEHPAAHEPLVEVPDKPKLPLINLIAAQFRPTSRDDGDADEPQAAPTPAKQARSRPESKPAVVQTEREPKPSATNYWKPLAYSGALALVLFAMSVLMKNPTAIFGDKAVAAVPAAKEADITPSTPPALHPDAKPTPAPPLSSSTPTAKESTPSILGPGGRKDVEPSERPVVVASASTPPTRTVRPAATQAKPAAKPRARKGHGSIRFYDADGNPIDPQ